MHALPIRSEGVHGAIQFSAARLAGGGGSRGNGRDHGAQMYSRIRSVDDGMRDAVRARLLQEYSGRGPKDIARLVAEARAGSPVEPAPPLVQRDVEFTSTAARGRWGTSSIVVRAEVTVDGAPPPDGRAVRYFRVQRKFQGEGWLVIGESDAYQYFMELFPTKRSYGGSN